MLGTDKFKPTTEAVRAERDALGVGAFEAGEKLRQAAMLDEVRSIRESHEPTEGKIHRVLDLIEALVLAQK